MGCTSLATLFEFQKRTVESQSSICGHSGIKDSWQIDGETVADFIFLGSKITADGDYIHEIKRGLFLGRKFMTNLFGEGNGTPLRYFCLENPMGGGAW